jgi:glycine hydroxymethyltransferase
VEEPALHAAGVRTVNDLARADWDRLRQAFHSQRMLGMALDAGGHLTHGFRHNISGKLFDQASYSTDPETGLIDYDALAAQAREFRPLILLAGYSAYPRTPDFRVLREIADEVGATLMVDMAHFAGLVAGGVLAGDLNPVPFADVVTSTTHKSLRGPRGGFVLCTREYAPYVDKGCPMVLGGPLPHVMAAKAVAFAEARQPAFAAYAAAILANAQALADGLLRRGVSLVSGGTSNHLVLMDVAASYGLTGRQAESALLDAGVVANRNSVPRDPSGAWYTSGIRLGTPALTTLGFGPAEMDEIAEIITVALRATAPAAAGARAKYTLDDRVAASSRERCAELLSRHPLYPGIQL